ncbi:MAG: glycosyltransferase family 39 protein [archaeon]
MRRGLVFILLLSLAARMLFPIDPGWDGSVYLGMGKYIYSGGSSGLWEPIRPPVWPLILGLVWKAGLPPVLGGKAVLIAFSLVSVALVYLIAEQFFDKKTALIASLLFSLAPEYIFSSHTLLAAVPATLFFLLALHQRGRPFICGIFIALAFLTKFYYGLFLVIFIAWRPRMAVRQLSGFIIPVAPYLILNHVMYGNPVFPMVSATQVISQVVGCTVLYPNPWYYYFAKIISENPLFLLALLGIHRAGRRGLLILCLALPLIYLMLQPCRTPRYFIFFLPALSILAAHGMMQLLKGAKLRAFVLFVSLAIMPIVAYHGLDRPALNPEYYSIRPVGSILTNNPRLSYSYDSPIGLLYYPLYGARLADRYSGLLGNTTETMTIYIDTCEGDLSCPPDDPDCPEATAHLLQTARTNFRTVYFQNRSRCFYSVLQTNRTWA